MKINNYPLLLVLLALRLSIAQTNTDSTEISRPMTTPSSPLITFSGDSVSTSAAWETQRRPEIYTFFQTEVYGKVPGEADAISFRTLEENDQAIDSLAIRRQVEVTLKKNNKEQRFTILLYLPKQEAPAPVFLGYNFYGNHTVRADSEIVISQAWTLENEAIGIEGHRLTAASRGGMSDRWPVREMIEKGYALATVFYGEIDPDKNDLSDGVQSLFYTTGQTAPAADEWGSVAAWAWGLSRVMDYLASDPLIDATQVVVFGHSRLGKSALWAGASDPRFAAVISNNSGCAGAALFKRKVGERVSDINTNFPHWFCENFKRYNDREETLRADQHEMLALMAPRPVYVASASEDAWADPQGEFLAAFHASPVYRLYQKSGISSMEMPQPNVPTQNTIAYHVRAGKHDITLFDWEQYLNWAEIQLDENP